MLVVGVAGMPAARSSMVAVPADVLPGTRNAVGYKTLLALGNVVADVVAAVVVVVVGVVGVANTPGVGSGSGAAVAAVTLATDMDSGPVAAAAPGSAASLFCCSCRGVAALDSGCPLQDRSKYRLQE